MKIDWDHAPDWAEAVGIRLHKNGAYGRAFICPYGYNYKLDLGKKAKCHPFNDGHAIGDFSIIEFRPKASAITWTGEGVPPAGTVCEVDGGSSSGGWGRCTIRYSSADVIVFKRDEYGFESFDCAGGEYSFRPIRTPKQIAAEEREAAVVEIERIALSGGTYKTMAEALYDAGYRKLETVDDDRA